MKRMARRDPEKPKGRRKQDALIRARLENQSGRSKRSLIVD
jgi:hypothetical protein